MATDVLPPLADVAEPYVAPRSDEQDLWLAVIVNAIADGFFRSDFQLRASSDGGRNDSFDADLVRGDSRRFLVMRWGPWAESRELVCAAADVDAELLRRACRVKLDAIKAAENTGEVISLDAELARLIDLENDLDPADLTAMLEKLAALEVAA